MPGRQVRAPRAAPPLPVMVGGIIVAATADQEVLARPGAVGRVATSCLVIGGAALFLAGHVLFKRVIWG